MSNIHYNIIASEKSKATARILILLGILSSVSACSGVVAVKAPWDEGFHVVAGDEAGTDADAIREIGIIEASKNERATETHSTYQTKIKAALQALVARKGGE